MHARTSLFALLLTGLVAYNATAEPGPLSLPELAEEFATPSSASQCWCYWWWLNGCVTRDGIVRDLDHMQAKGIGGALVFHAGNGQTPFQIEFMSPAWRDLFRFAVEEAAQRDIVIGFNICGGWNAGGPWVQPDDAARTLSFHVVTVKGPRTAITELSLPESENLEHYRDIAVLAWRNVPSSNGAPTVVQRDTMLVLTHRLKGNQLSWDVPEGHWTVVRFGHHVHPRARTKCTGGRSYLEIDPLRSDAMDHHFAATAAVLIDDVRDHVGKTFQYVHIDSGEIGKPDWTPAFRDEFRQRRGYDCWPFLVARTGTLVDNPEITARFNEDYERTLGDLMVEHYYGRLGELARRHGMGTHCEAAGYQKPCVDALRALGVNDICMSEFWVRRSGPEDSYIHQLSEQQVRNHDGIKTAAAAAHTYGRSIVMAEAYTVMNGASGFPNYSKDPFSLKDTGDRAFCAGLNRHMLCFLVHQPHENEQPGYEWPGVGTEFNRHVTWWTMGDAWLTYLARCQSLLQAGDFVADACYFSGEWVPNYVPARWAMHPALPPGYGCDTVNAECLRGAAIGNCGQLQLDSGMQYRYLVLNQGGRWRLLSRSATFPGNANDPDDQKSQELAAADRPLPLAVSPKTLARIQAMVKQGMTLIGPPPTRAIGLTDYPQCDAEIQRLVSTLWGPAPANAGQRRVGKGRVIWGKGLDEVFAADDLPPDLEIREDVASAASGIATLNGIPNPTGSFDWIHRRVDGADVYFIANLRSVDARGEFTFRVADRQPELWDAVTGRIRDLPEYRQTEGRTVIPLRFAPRQSWFVVFRAQATTTKGAKDAKGKGAKGKGADNAKGKSNFPKLEAVETVGGPWSVQFGPSWFYPDNGTGGNVRFDQLEDWSRRSEEAIRYYSGLATYCATFEFTGSDPDAALYLDLGVVKNIAQVRLNGQNLGVIWTAPWRVEVTRAIGSGVNELEVDVVNLWPNRLIGDASLPQEDRRTVTNIPAIKPSTPLLESGLLGPVTLQVAQ